MLSRNNWQKSPSRRFLLILGGVVFVCIFAWGIMVIFDKKIFVNMSETQRLLFGGLIIIYSVLRFSRLLTRRQDNDDQKI